MNTNHRPEVEDLTRPDLEFTDTITTASPDTDPLQFDDDEPSVAKLQEVLIATRKLAEVWRMLAIVHGGIPSTMEPMTVPWESDEDDDLRVYKLALSGLVAQAKSLEQMHAAIARPVRLPPDRASAQLYRANARVELLEGTRDLTRSSIEKLLAKVLRAEKDGDIIDVAGALADILDQEKTRAG